MFAALIQASTFLWRHTKTHADSNRCHSERDFHRSTTTQLWNADMSTSSNHTKAFSQCCHGKHTVASTRTLLSDHVCSAYKWMPSDLTINACWQCDSQMKSLFCNEVNCCGRPRTYWELFFHPDAWASYSSQSGTWFYGIYD